jgi:hypothetical protein
MSGSDRTSRLSKCGEKGRGVSVSERLRISRGILVRHGLFEDGNLSVKVAKLILERPRVGSAFFELLLQSGAPDPKGIQIGFKVFHFRFSRPGVRSSLRSELIEHASR